MKEAVSPTPLPGGTRCHAGCGSVTEIDIALVGVGSPSTNVAGSIAGIVCNGDLLTMDGARSGKQTYEVGGLVIEHEIGGACWAGLIQLHARRTGLLPVGLGVAMATMPQDGDSGAWVLNGTEWAGMVVASDKSMFGYAIAADTLVKHHLARDDLEAVERFRVRVVLLDQGPDPDGGDGGSWVASTPSSTSLERTGVGRSCNSSSCVRVLAIWRPWVADYSSVSISNYRPAGQKTRGVTSITQPRVGPDFPPISADDASYPAYADDSNDSAR
ncbi:MAG: hypothetical protein OXU77_22600 [Gammaproteobacteria bacterium]|nr:hypothetical protein [Gammaproteobacteria bacterium]